MLHSGAKWFQEERSAHLPRWRRLELVFFQVVPLQRMQGILNKIIQVTVNVFICLYVFLIIPFLFHRYEYI